MNKRDIGVEILSGLKEVKAFKKGSVQLKVIELSEPSEPKVIRSQLNLSQSAFAGLLVCWFAGCEYAHPSRLGAG